MDAGAPGYGGTAPADDKWGGGGGGGGDAGGGGGDASDARRPSTLGTMVDKAKAAPAKTVGFFKEKPKQSTACVLLFFTTCMMLLAMMVPWFRYWGDDSDYWGHTTLFRNTACSKIGSRKDTTSSRSCTLTELVHIAKDLDYFRQAGGVGFAFLLLSWFCCLLACYMMYKHRMNRGADIPEKFGPLRSYESPAVLVGLATFLIFFSWVCYVGVVNTKNSDSHLTLLNSGKKVKRHLFGSGVAFTVLAQFFLPASAVLWFMFKKESGTDAGGAAAEAPAAGGNATVPSAAYPSAYGDSAAGTTNPVGPGGYGADGSYTGYGTPAAAPAAAPAAGYGGDAGYPAPAGGTAADDAYAEAQRRAASGV